MSALPVSTVPPASSVTSRDEDVPTPSGSPAGASSSSCSTPSTDYKKLVRLIIPKVKLGSEMSSVEKQCLSLSRSHKLNVSDQECASIVSSMCSRTPDPPKSNVSIMPALGHVPGDNLTLLKKSTEEELGKKMGTIHAGGFCVDPFIDSFLPHLIVPERLHPHVTSYLSAFLSQYA